MNVMSVTLRDGSNCYALTEDNLPRFVENLRLRGTLDCTGGDAPDSLDAPTAAVILNWDFVVGVTLCDTL